MTIALPIFSTPLADASMPIGTSRHIRLLDSETGRYVLVADGSRVYGVSDAQWDELRAADDGEIQRLMTAWGVAGQPYVDDVPPETPAERRAARFLPSTTDWSPG